MRDYADQLECRAEQLFQCADCGAYLLESETYWWSMREIAHEIPVCKKDWDRRDAADHLYTFWRIKNLARALAVALLLGTVVGLAVYVTVNAIEGWFR
jgi:hypothetical protein